MSLSPSRPLLTLSSSTRSTLRSTSGSDSATASGSPRIWVRCLLTSFYVINAVGPHLTRITYPCLARPILLTYLDRPPLAHLPPAHPFWITHPSLIHPSLTHPSLTARHQIFQACGVPIYSVLQNPIKDREDAMFVVTTDPVDVSKIKAACVQLEATEWCLGDTFYMPIL